MADSGVKSNAKYKAFIVLQCLIWGIGNPITKFVYVFMTPFCYMAVRFALSSILFIVCFYKSIKADWEWKKIRNCTIVGLFMGATYIFANLSIRDSMVTIAGFLMGISVIFTSLISVLFLKSKLTKTFLVSLAAVIAGMYMLCCGGTGEFFFGTGEFYALMSSLCMALTLLLSSKFINAVNPVTLSMVQCSVTAIVCAVFGFLLEDFSCVLTADIKSWICLLYLALGCTIAAFLLQNISIKHLSPIFVSLALCVEPIFTAIASFFILGEVITITGFVGSALIIAGVVAASVMGVNENRPR